MQKLSVAFSLFFVVFTAAHAEVYVWVDENGKKHYSDQPPPDRQGGQTEVEIKEYEIENIDTGYPAGIVVDPTRKARKQKEIAQRKEAAARLQAQCQEAREDLSAISGRVVFHDNGTVVSVTEAERRAMQQELEATISRHCE